MAQPSNQPRSIVNAPRSERSIEAAIVLAPGVQVPNLDQTL
jgi:hypothetical protein